MLFFDGDRAELLNLQTRAPIVPREQDGFTASFTRALDTFGKTQFDAASAVNRQDVWENEIQRFKDVGGRIQELTPQQKEDLRTDASGRYRGDYGWFRYQVDLHNQALGPEAPPFELPPDEEIERRGMAYARSAQQDMAARETAPGGVAGAVGALAGDMLGQMVQPSNIVAFSLFGAGPGMGFMRAAGQDMLAGAAGQMLNEGVTWQFKRELDPNYSVGDMAANVAEAGAYGAAFSIGQRAIGFGLRRSVDYWRRWRESGAPITREMQDAGNVVEHAANVEASNPYPAQGLAGENAHVAAMQEAYARASKGQPVEVPAQTAALAREKPAETVERRLREQAPEVMQRLDDLERAREVNRGALDTLNVALSEAEPAGVRRLLTQIDEAQAKVERLQAAAEKATSEKQRAKLQAQVEAAQAKVAELEGSVDVEAYQRMQEAEATRAIRSEVLSTVEAKLAEQKALVDRMRKEELERYWQAARAGAPEPVLPAAMRGEVDRLRGAIDEGTVPAAADLERDLSQALEVMKAADERGQAVGAYLAGLDHVDMVNARVRALIGLMHEESTLATRVSPAEAARRVRSLVDEMTGERAAGPAASPPEAPRGVESAASPAAVTVPTPEEIVKEAADPKVREAAVMDANRLLAERPDLEVRADDGNVVKLSDVFAQLDDEIMAAAELQACALGKEAAE